MDWVDNGDHERAEVGGLVIVLRGKSVGSTFRWFYVITRDGADVASGNVSSRGAAEAAIWAEVV